MKGYHTEDVLSGFIIHTVSRVTEGTSPGISLTHAKECISLDGLNYSVEMLIISYRVASRGGTVYLKITIFFPAVLVSLSKNKDFILVSSIMAAVAAFRN